MVLITCKLFELAVDVGGSPVSGFLLSWEPCEVRQSSRMANDFSGWKFEVRQLNPLNSLSPRSPARLTTFSLER